MRLQQGGIQDYAMDVMGDQYDYHNNLLPPFGGDLLQATDCLTAVGPDQGNHYS